MYSRVSAHFARVFAVYSHTLRESCVPRVLAEYQCVFSHVFISRVPRLKMVNCHILPPASERLPIDRISHHLLQIKQTHLILKALDESFQEH